MKKVIVLFFMVMLVISFSKLAFSQNIPVKITPVGIVTNPSIVDRGGNNGNSIESVPITVLANNGGTSGNGRQPQGSRRFINTKYLITGPEATASGFGSDAVASVGWRWNTFSGAGQSLTTTGRLIVYMKDTVGSAIAIGSSTIDTNGTGYTKVIEGTITIPTTASDFTIDVPVGGPGTSTFNHTDGNGIIVIFVYTTIGTLSTTSPTCICNTTYANSLSTYQSNTANGVAGTLSNFRPETRLGAASLFDKVQVTEVYALGKVPRPFGIPYNVSAIVKNNDSGPLTFDVVLTVKDSSSGTVRYTKNMTVTSLASGASQEVFFTEWLPNRNENDSLIVSIDPQPGENYIANNVLRKITRVNSNTYSYAQSNTPVGGVGFNGATGDFVARFHTNSANSINQIDVNFSAGGQPFQVGIWDASGTGGIPGSNLFTSTSQTSAAGVFTVLVNPPISVNGDFFVGVRQTGTTNVSFSYQTESPIRDSCFYFASPTGSTSWTDFAPNNAFRFMIEPKFALNNDVGASAIDQNGSVYYTPGTTTLPMTGTVTNYGLSTNTFDVNRTILDASNNIVYNNTITISSLVSNGTAVTTFPNFTGFVSGATYTITDSTRLGTDQNVNNNKLSKSFTPTIAKTTCILYTDAPSRDSLSNQLNNAGYIGTYDLIDGTTFTSSFRAWRSVFYLLTSGGTWTTSVRDSLKAFLDNSSPSSKKSLCIFGNDIGYYNDPIRNTTATGPDTVFYRQYLRAQYVADSWISAVAGSGSKIYGASGSPFSSITGDSVGDPYPDMVKAATWYGGQGAFLPLTVTTGDSSAAVYYAGTNYNLFYGTNVYANYRSKTSSTLDAPTNIFNVIKNFVESNGGLVPVELASFSAATDRDKVILNWRTVSELNNSGYDIERKSISGNSWAKIGFIQGNGTSNIEKNYSFTDVGLTKGSYNYRLKQIDFNGNYKYYDLSSEVNIGVPFKFDLSQNYPNPFNPSTKINYDLPFDSKVSIKLFDIIGREIVSLVNQAQTAGYYTTNFNASNLSSGVYFYQINAQGGNQSFTKTLKMMLVK